MNLRQTAELAGHLAAEADTIDDISRLRIARSVGRYRDCCRRRLDIWTDQIVPSAKCDVEQIRPIIAEVFVTEMLTSVWSGVFHAFGHRTDDAEIAAAAHEAFQLHQSARHRAMTWMLQQSDESPRAISEIDVMRRKCERWTDVLLGITTAPVDWHRYAHEPERARDFSEEHLGKEASVRNQMLYRSLRTAYSTVDCHFSPAILCHDEIAVSLTTVLPSSARLLANSAPLQFRSRAVKSPIRFSRLMANREPADPDQD